MRSGWRTTRCSWRPRMRMAARRGRGGSRSWRRASRRRWRAGARSWRWRLRPISSGSGSSSGNGGRCARLAGSTASASWAMCRFTWRTTARTCGRLRSFSGWMSGAAPLKVAGVPPDYFSATGQLWGNPTYRWERLRTGRLRLVDGAAARRAAAVRSGAAWTTSGASRRTSRLRREPRRRCTATGSRLRGRSCSRR